MHELLQAIPDVNKLLSLEPERLGTTLLFLLRARPLQGGKFSLDQLKDDLWKQSHLPGEQTPYPTNRRKEIDTALTEAWAWLQSQLLIVPDADNGKYGWWVLSRRAKNLKNMADLAQFAGARVLPSELTIIAETRLVELRNLASPQFDFTKLVRLCEELNMAYSAGSYFATAMLTRGLLDHVPPLFGMDTFSEVTNNYGGGGRRKSSFKEAMGRLENAARKVADAHLHAPIRKSETLPVAQQVNFAPELDVLLSEIVRITK